MVLRVRSERCLPDNGNWHHRKAWHEIRAGRASTAVEGLYETLGPLYVALLLNRSIRPGQVPALLRETAKRPGIPEELAELPKGVAASLEASDIGGWPQFGVINGGKDD